MTFEEFRSTRRSVPDLGKAIPDVDSAGPGLTYCGDALHIEDTAGWPDDAPGKGKGRWYALIGVRDHQSDDLEEVERELYRFAVSEGFEV